ncbi:hypothetical protein EYZ11_003204 [Aspergillus tanneri]|uniref:ATP-dependent DNA helicase n=1 Tax=Aspergillus tanneri TaxID=1220188 RepID=A0A4S3JNU5_9EURO|nr:hypothetical protein EYZ11_003204 [Aspergillus tanneri]
MFTQEDYFDDGIDNFVVDDLAGVSSSSQSCDAPRPAKRRRLDAANRKETSRGHGGYHRRGTDSDSSLDNDNGVDECPSPSQALGHFVDEVNETKSKYKSFVPKRTSNRDNIFVTQLTQPASPPEIIRGPRWKKPDQNPPRPSPPVQKSEGGGREGNGRERAHVGEVDEFDGDDGLNEAIAASLQSFEEEQSRNALSPIISEPPPKPAAASTGQKDNAADTLVDIFDDIPDDAFDSDFSMSPPPPTALRTTNGSFTQSSMRPLGVRQTTLFDMAARNPANQPLRGEQVLSPPNKNEPPTQHRLDQEAIATWVFPTNLALPTGLGKTFIAATIMLNWFRWTESAQIIFVAPTKPLVAQQISACFGIAGIPRSQTTMLTGGVAPGIRAEEWREKRVFFMTPQTLINDLKSGIADPKRIVLVVVDEAHRATGSYAYVEVVKFVRRYNQSFRVLALTATPGSNVEAVQAVVDGLDISRVEIRTEQSLDIREYVHSRNTEIQTFKNSDEMVLCMDLFSRALQPLVDQLQTLNAYWGRDPMMLTAYGLTKSRQQWMGSDAGRNASFGLKGKVNSIFTVLASLAHGIDLLKYHGITPFYRHLVHFQSNTDGQKGGKYQRQVVQDESYKKLMSHLEPWTKNPEFIGHPKLEYLKQVVLNHFMDAGEGASASDKNSQSATRIMIFVHFRDSAEEVVRVLRRYEPMIRPHVFVGQSSAKGSDGMDQKTQLQIVQKFKQGTYNTIVATSIGEEGLDIGEVDLIVCYDSSASPVRMLQRMGRTGRKRAGNIVLLLMEGKEEQNYLKAKDNYEKMQQMIASGTRFTFHDDRSPRILPPTARPVVDKRNVDIPQENATQDLPEPKRKRRAPKKPPKKFHMPDNVETGFTRVSRLFGGSARKPDRKRVRTPTPEPVDLPALEDVLLTAEQQRELEHHYCNIGDTSPQVIRHPRNDAFPRLQLIPRPTKAVKHGALTRRMIGTLQKMNQLDAECENRFRKVLELELGRPADDSVVVNQSGRHGGLMNSRVHSRKPKTLRPSKPAHQKEPNNDDLQLISPAKLLSFFTAHPESRPFYSSQRSNGENLDDDFDPPDLTTLLSQSAESRSRKQSRTVLDDDNDY